MPVPQLVTQAPPLQYGVVPLQVVPHPPQWPGSRLVSTQTPPQAS